MKRAANLSVDAALSDEAEALNLDLSQVFETGLRDAVAAERAADWKCNNAAALRSSNEYVETHGLPLARYRRF